MQAETTAVRMEHDEVMGRLRQRIEAVQKLKEMPCRFPIDHAMVAMKQEIRYFPAKNHLAFYVVREESRTVEIWRMLHRLQHRKRG